MIRIERYPTLKDSKENWEKLQKGVPHYPFQSFWYNSIFAKHFCKEENVYILGIYDGENLIGIGAFEKVDQKIVFLGMKKVLTGEDVTDYGDILIDQKQMDMQEVWNAIITHFKNTSEEIQLDFVREDSAAFSITKQLSNATISTQEVSPFVTLPVTWDDYLAMLDRKERHELKRKISRLESQHSFHLCKELSHKEHFEEFVRLHRMSDPKKAQFMSEEMKVFFWDLVTGEKNDTWWIDFCSLTLDNKTVASTFSFISNEQVLLYNSGYDPSYDYFSVGVLLKAFVIKKAIEERRSVFDFLRGEERYKYDLGGKDLQLYKIHI